jgi:hypothetical protein
MGMPHSHRPDARSPINSLERIKFEFVVGMYVSLKRLLSSCYLTNARRFKLSTFTRIYHRSNQQLFINIHCVHTSGISGEVVQI